MTNDETKLLEADAQRRAAMIANDVTTLARLLGDDLIWTHSSGKVDDKRSFLAGIESGSVAYRALDVSGIRIARHGDVFLLHGTLDGRASRDGIEKVLRNRFLSVWSQRAGGFELLAWQSTGL
ncbi:MAG: nuclear transport factor 2 family protein [Pseudomonadales bacterium]